MIEELSALAIRIKQFVRSVPKYQEGVCYDNEDEYAKQAIAHFSSELLAKAAVAARKPLSFTVENLSLTLADLRGYENTVNSEPFAKLPGSGIGLFRVVKFEIFGVRRDRQELWVSLEYSPLGWPELPDMVAKDLNELFRTNDAAPLETEVEPRSKS